VAACVCGRHIGQVFGTLVHIRLSPGLSDSMFCTIIRNDGIFMCFYLASSAIIFCQVSLKVIIVFTGPAL